ncbi:hypothetical protein [Mycobacterium sp.]|uniref:hypothetical protein n=1 Tax=Mycobacterium sp. TaxID=1785 RepID=UPI003D148521
MTVEQYAAQIWDWASFDRENRRHRGMAPVDPNVVFTSSRVAAAWERLRWDIHAKGASLGDRSRLDELTVVLQKLSTALGFEGTIDPDDWLPDDPGTYLAGRGPRNELAPWFEHCSYAPREA